MWPKLFTQKMAQIQVKFFNKTSSLNPILLPVNLKRRGLSQVINHLLNTQTPYDFLINNEYLTGSIQTWIEERGISRVRFWAC
jgi:ribosome biogenesis protein YTM1